MGKRFGYVRTSTADQRNGIDVQIDALLAFDPQLDRRDIFVEKVSGGLHHTKRPKLHQLLAQLTETDVVYIYRTDRLGRSTSDLLTIVEKIKDAGGRLVSITDGIDTGTGMVADMFLTLLSVVAQYERSLISDRTRSSLRILKERGVELGRPRKVTSVIIRQVQKMHDDPQVSVKDVCASLGISRSSYYQALRHPK
ncbi:recombinase family protein [uncultured Tateyamaria sp.]|uniref:recombinase family protein n=1 Tax=uncultured Tateyamaria sp. TaxID=455651 RepID=UPI0026188441|nr:recombinase family protein [uncultured Tateyamaria sp.]